MNVCNNEKLLWNANSMKISYSFHVISIKIFSFINDNDYVPLSVRSQSKISEFPIGSAFYQMSFIIKLFSCNPHDYKGSE